MRRPPPAAAAVAVTVAAVLAGCGGSDGSSSTDPTTTTLSAIGDEPDPATSSSAESSPTTTAAESTTSAAATTTTTSTVPAATTEFGQLAGTEIVLLTPATGNGPKPLLTWEPVVGASTYDVIVNTLDGGPYWAWRGATSEVWLGGHEPEPDPDTEGPVLVEPMLLTVVATDDSGIPLAGIGPVEIAP